MPSTFSGYDAKPPCATGTVGTASNRLGWYDCRLDLLVICIAPSRELVENGQTGRLTGISPKLTPIREILEISFAQAD